MGSQPVFRNPIWEQMQKIKLTREGGLEAPVKANGKDGIVIGDPPLAVPPRATARERGAGALARLKRILARV